MKIEPEIEIDRKPLAVKFKRVDARWIHNTHPE